MLFDKIRNTKLFWFIKNICVFWRCDLYKEIEEIKYAQRQMGLRVSPAYFVNEIFRYVYMNTEEREKYRIELEYLANSPQNIVFPYKKIKTLNEVIVKFDANNKMHYVVHENKKIYFPQDYTKEDTKRIYINYIETENILGGDYTEKSPHQYESAFCKVEKNDVLLDIGCAEALFALHHIEVVKEVYLIESDKKWMKALMLTFEPYKDKVHIINKYIDVQSSENAISIQDILTNIDEKDVVFIKMDIESAEKSVILTSVQDLKNRKVKLSCCTYHKKNDYEVISNALSENGFRQECSDGYMLFIWDDDFTPPYFRHGIVRGKNV